MYGGWSMARTRVEEVPLIISAFIDLSRVDAHPSLPTWFLRFVIRQNFSKIDMVDEIKTAGRRMAKTRVERVSLLLFPLSSTYLEQTCTGATRLPFMALLSPGHYSKINAVDEKLKIEFSDNGSAPSRTGTLPEMQYSLHRWMQMRTGATEPYSLLPSLW
jgi:hypothetical protein